MLGLKGSRTAAITIAGVELLRRIHKGQFNLRGLVRTAGEAAGLGDAIHPHMLRHGAGYALINDGVDVRLVQEFLGHASITSTAIYTAISRSGLRG